MLTPRGAGILLHPTSLPGPHGIGDLGDAAHAWIDFLTRAGQRLWQVLPLGPTGFGDSPYQSFSAFAGNPYLVSPERLVADGLLTGEDLGGAPRTDPDRVDFGTAIRWKVALLERAHARFAAGRGDSLRAPFAAFKAEHRSWLDDFALFMALKASQDGAWNEWEEGLALREAGPLAAARATLESAIEAQRFHQFLFFRQGADGRAHARAAGVRILGDIPIFVAFDSADVWAHRELFELDALGRATVVAGVPPDYFSPTGQRWGNPLYRWKTLERAGYGWWIERVRAQLALVDLIRADHFRGFVAHWEVPAAAPTAETGRWVEGPGRRIFDALEAALGALPIVAEDLGDITPEVERLRDSLGLPGMKVLQFAFGDDASNAFLPHRFERNCVVYTGTHDNDTTRGWYEVSATARERDFARRYLRSDGHDFAWDLIRLAFASVADLAIVPLQDALDLGTEARMNLPGRLSGNWRWRFRAEHLTPALGERLRELATLYGR